MLDVVGYEVDSGVDHQPIGVEMTLLGAGNRAMRAAEQDPHYDYAVGIESGIYTLVVPRIARICPFGLDTRVYDTQWVVVLKCSEDSPAIAPIQNNPVPPALIGRMGGPGEGVGLGRACDEYFGRTGSKTEGGLTSLYSDGLLTRSGEIAGGVILAMQQFLKPHLWQA